MNKLDGTSQIQSNEPKKIVILGATGGIGLALINQLIHLGHSVTGYSRQTDPSLQLENEQTILAIAEASGSDIDWLINATGVLSDRPELPERSLKSLNPTAMLAQFAVNAVGPALVIKHFSQRMTRHRPALIASLSARVSSISDNRLGGWYSYRASKAALNQIVKTASIELKRTHPKLACVALHPGTVATRLSEKFQPTNARSPKDAASDLINVMEKLTADHTGLLMDYQGQVIQW